MLVSARQFLADAERRPHILRAIEQQCREFYSGKTSRRSASASARAIVFMPAGWKSAMIAAFSASYLRRR
jgi:hypothetical protein